MAPPATPRSASAATTPPTTPTTTTYSCQPAAPPSPHSSPAPPSTTPTPSASPPPQHPCHHTPGFDASSCSAVRSLYDIFCNTGSDGSTTSTFPQNVRTGSPPPPMDSDSGANLFYEACGTLTPITALPVVIGDRTATHSTDSNLPSLPSLSGYSAHNSQHLPAVQQQPDHCVEVLRDAFLPQEVQFQPWQQDALQLLDSQSDRKILFVVDRRGTCGKTWLAKYICANYHSLYFNTTTMGDVPHLYVDHKVVMFDLSREASRHIQYETLECLKDGMGSSTEHECKEKIFLPAKVIVMMHRTPDMEALTADRYHIQTVVA